MKHPFQSNVSGEGTYWDCDAESRRHIVRQLKTAGDVAGLRMILEQKTGGPPLQATVRKAAEAALRVALKRRASLPAHANAELTHD